MARFPNAPDNIPANVSNGTPEVDLHPGLHNQLADALNAVEAALLPGGSMSLAAHIAAGDPHPATGGVPGPAGPEGPQGEPGPQGPAGADGVLTGPAGGSLSGTYPNPGLADSAVTSAKIADGTIVAGDIADGAVTSAKILDGTIATADLANSSVTNVKLASDTARANLLTNGSFDVWQRGAGVFSTTGTYTADRWVLSIGAGSTLQVSRESTVGNLDTGSQHAAACVYTHSAQSFVSQLLTEQALGLRGKTLTISMRVKTSVANAVRVDLVGTVTARVVGTYHTGSGTYQTLNTTISLDANETGLQVQVVFNASCSAWLDNAMLVVGSQAADYAPLHPADDLARCQRYYERIGGNAPSILGYAGTAGENWGQTLFWKMNKPVTPSFTLTGSATVTNCGQPTFDKPTLDCGRWYTGATATGAFECSLGAQYLTIEANP